MKRIVFSLLLLSITTLLSAQYTRGGGGAFSFGMQTWSLDGLDAFAPNGPTLPSNNLSWGGYGYWQFNDWVVGFKGAGIYGRERLDDTYAYNMQGGHFMLDFGYKVINNQKFGLYPFAGVGWGGAGYSIDEKWTINLSESGVNKPVLYSGSYNWSNAVFDVGFRIEQLFGLKQKGEETDGGLIGLELGYMFTPTSNDWRSNTNATIIGAPDFNMNGFYARVTFGGFGGQ